VAAGLSPAFADSCEPRVCPDLSGGVRAGGGSAPAGESPARGTRLRHRAEGAWSCYSRLKACGREALFSAIDVSRDLVAESAQKTRRGRGRSSSQPRVRSGRIGFFWPTGSTAWRGCENLPRLITFFGLVPNSCANRSSRGSSGRFCGRATFCWPAAHLRAHRRRHGVSGGDAIGASAYDNPETRAWLNAALEHAGLKERVEPPEMEDRGRSREFRPLSPWPDGNQARRLKKGPPFFSPKKEEPLPAVS